ncbi:MAG TPA: glutamine-hydrolyzing carbamoyl-phosphate synthase small subunit [Actinomycetes bacterium]|jgi:carbamoyl-phosphate synthase small subunit|nr:glutamine-hydrolyzing carbamoyl-phosphate synthase small subunit [Actinomycetes bacterium]
MTRQALLVLEDGAAFRGEAFTPGRFTVAGEVVFNTAMSGYQEVLTDPSYHRQLVCMAAPEVGNYGTNGADGESERVQVAAFLVRQAARRPSSWRAQRSLAEELEAAGVPGVEGLDTRRLVRHLRTAGAMRGALSSDTLDPEALRAAALAAPDPNGLALAEQVTRPAPAELPADGAERFRVVLYDFGAKASIARRLRRLGARVLVVPAATPAARALAWRPDGVVLSNGPGDPATVGSGVQAARELLGRVPLLGICLGHQLLGRAVGGRTVRLRFGHRGVNQPVVEVATGRVAVTSHNHGFAVEAASLPAGVRVTHVNANDGVVEGLACADAPAFSVQYHPEAAPGPHDAHPLFERFAALMEGAHHG